MHISYHFLLTVSSTVSTTKISSVTGRSALEIKILTSMPRVITKYCIIFSSGALPYAARPRQHSARYQTPGPNESRLLQRHYKRPHSSRVRTNCYLDDRGPSFRPEIVDTGTASYHSIGPTAQMAYRIRANEITALSSRQLRKREADLLATTQECPSPFVAGSSPHGSSSERR